MVVLECDLEVAHEEICCWMTRSRAITLPMLSVCGTCSRLAKMASMLAISGLLEVRVDVFGADPTVVT